MPTSTRIGLKLAFAASVAAFLVALPQAASALEKVRILIPVRTVDEAFSPFTVAKEKGYFEAEGYDVTLLAVGGSNEAAIQVSAGNAEVGAASPGEAVVGIQSGQLKIQYYFDLYYANIWSVRVLPDSPIKVLADLKGKRLGVQSMGSAGTTFAKAFVKEAGLDPAADISFLPIGLGAQAVTSVNQKLVDGVIFWDAALAKLAFSGLKLREVPAPENLRTLPDVGLLARTETIEKNPKMLIGIARAVAKGYDYSMANPEAAVLITWKMYPEARSKNPDATEALKEGVVVNQGRMAIWNSEKVGAKHGLFIEADWKRLLQFLKDQGAMPDTPPVDKVITNKFIDQINAYDRDGVVAEAKKEDMAKLR
jgi:ABC-type nitrate/sulfonate/bicarbonate transport system substrate-binding protein